MNANKEQAEALLAAGLRDRLTLRLLLESGEAPEEAIGFHAQQACEKFLKAMLLMHGLIFDCHELGADSKRRSPLAGDANKPRFVVE